MKTVTTIKLLNDGIEKPVTEEWKLNVSYIKDKYLFYNYFNLEKALIDVVRTYAYLKALYLEIPARKEIRKKIDKLQILMTELVNELNTTQDEIKAGLDRFAKYPTYTITESEQLKNNWNFETYSNDSKLALSAIHLMLPMLLPNKSGANPDASNKDILRLLIAIFEEGTGKTVSTLIKNGRKNLYLDKDNKNEIVEFISDVECLLERIGINFKKNALGQHSTISEIINKILEERHHCL